MDVIYEFYKLCDYLNEATNEYMNFSLIRIEGFSYSINFNYTYFDKINEKDKSFEVKNVLTLDGENISLNSSSLDRIKENGVTIPDAVFVTLEENINTINSNPDKKFNLYILKSNYSDSVVLCRNSGYSKTYFLKEINVEDNDLFNSTFLFTIEHIKQIERNPNILFSYYLVPVTEVLSPIETLDNSRTNIFPFSKELYIDATLFDSDQYVDYYQTVLKIKKIVNESIDSFKNKVVWIDNYLIVNNKFTIQFYEEHISYDFEEIKDEVLALKLFHICSNYNSSTHKSYNKYVVIDTDGNFFLKSVKTPIGDIQIVSIHAKNILDFDENSIFYLEEINEKFSEDILSEFYREGSKYAVVLWENIHDYKDTIFKDVTYERFTTIITQLNGISKRVV